MKRLAFCIIVLACGVQETPPNIVPSGELAGKQLYTLSSPVNDHASAIGISNFDIYEIDRSKLCPRGFSTTVIDFSPVSPDGVSTKKLSFYCL